MSRAHLLTGASKIVHDGLRTLHEELNPAPAAYKPPSNMEAVQAQLAGLMKVTDGDKARMAAAKEKRARKAAKRLQSAQP